MAKQPVPQDLLAKLPDFKGPPVNRDPLAKLPGTQEPCPKWPITQDPLTKPPVTQDRLPRRPVTQDLLMDSIKKVGKPITNLKEAGEQNNKPLPVTKSTKQNSSFQQGDNMQGYVTEPTPTLKTAVFTLDPNIGIKSMCNVVYVHTLINRAKFGEPAWTSLRAP